MAACDSMADIIREDILTCQICFNLLIEPRTLPCLHTYCTNCVTNMVEVRAKKTRWIRCPECRNDTKLIRTGIDDTKQSFFIHSLMEIYNTKRQHVICTVCEKNDVAKKAVSKCTTCLDGLCEECSKGHLRSTMTAHHQVVPLEDFASGTYDSCLRESQKYTCDVHKRDIEFYCDSCESVGCMMCIMLKHKDHKYDTVSVSYDSKKDNLKSMFSDVMSKVDNMSKAKVKLAELSTLADKKNTTIYKDISDAGQVVIRAVQKEVAETKKNAEKLIKPRRQRLMKLNSDLEKKLNKWKISIEFCQKILDSGKPVEVLQIEGLLKKRLHQLNQEEDRTNVTEIEFSTRVMDLHVNKEFKGDVSLGMFKPEQKLSKGVPVCDFSTQTEDAFSGLPAASKSNISDLSDAADSDSSGEARDFGCEALHADVAAVEDCDSCAAKLRENSSGTSLKKGFDITSGMRMRPGREQSKSAEIGPGSKDNGSISSQSLRERENFYLLPLSDPQWINYGWKQLGIWTLCFSVKLLEYLFFEFIKIAKNEFSAKP